jgi:hypothetical protein
VPGFRNPFSSSCGMSASQAAQLNIALAAIRASLARLEIALNTVLHLEGATAMDVTKLTDQVAKNTTVVGGALVLIQGLAEQQKALAKQLADAIAAGDPVALAAAQKAIDDSAAALASSDDALAAAVAANTPVPLAA